MGTPDERIRREYSSPQFKGVAAIGRVTSRLVVTAFRRSLDDTARRNRTA